MYGTMNIKLSSCFVFVHFYFIVDLLGLCLRLLRIVTEPPYLWQYQVKKKVKQTRYRPELA
jgi:hypothetical protein